jgi:ABC-2 type transport system ATP-binding protein
MSEPAIGATGLRKSYGPKSGLGGVDLAVPVGSVLALLGPTARAGRRSSTSCQR